MRRILMAAALVLTGCQSTYGPFEYRPPQRVDDPRISIPEQEARGRDRLALPQVSNESLPRDYGPTLGQHYP